MKMAANMTRNVNLISIANDLAIPDVVLFNRRCGSVTGGLDRTHPQCYPRGPAMVSGSVTLLLIGCLQT